jgi:hypothetical protein
MTLICTVCEEEVDEVDWHGEDELCTDCFQNSGDDGDKYCCGAIYEDGEDTCMSCGEPLS